MSAHNADVSGVLKSLRERSDTQGVTLIELMVVVAIVGILASLAIPSIIGSIHNARLVEATTNIQGILESEQAYFTRFQHYTDNLGNCPGAGAAAACNAGSHGVDTVQFLVAGCDAGWALLGWQPAGSVLFQYSVLSHWDDPNELGTRTPTANGLPVQSYGVDWTADGFNNVATMQPWCAVMATGDTDCDGASVFIRTNSYNHRVHRSDDLVW